MKNIKFSLPVIAVKDINKSKQFYESLFDLEIRFDFGLNVAYKEGLSLQQDFDWLCSISKESICYKSHNMELCFEAENYDDFYHKLKGFESVDLVHDTILYDWGQRVIRFYDPDGHIIEVGEAMTTVVRNLLKTGLSSEEVSEKTMHPLDFVKSVM